MGIVNDFIVDSNQHCFLCLTQISQSVNLPSVKVEPESQPSQSQSATSSSIYSIQYLSRYVEVDILKVFNYDDAGAAAIPPHLVDKVRGSKLKVELCGDCAHLNANFSERLRQLEKLEMELGVSLSRILDKLLKAEKLGKEEQFQMLKVTKSTGSSAVAEVKGKLEIMKALRKDVLEKSSSKLAEIPPRVSIPKPNPNTKRNMNMNKLKFSYSFGSRKKQAILHNPLLRFRGRSSQTTSIKGVHGHFETVGAWEEAVEPIQTSSQECQPTEEITAGNGNNVKVWLIPPPPPVPVDTSSISSKAASSSSAQDTVEDYVCAICGMRFMFLGNLQFHSQMVHNKTTIPRRSSIPRQVGKPGKSIVTCRRCGSVFPRMKYLQRHLKSAHTNELGHACKDCGLIFGAKIQLKKHRRLEHNLKSKSSEVITPDDPTDIRDDYSPATTVLVSNLETVETRIVKIETDYDPLAVLSLSCEETENSGISTDPSTPYNEGWTTGLPQAPKTIPPDVPEMECDICHLMVTDISTHLYTVHFKQSGGR